MPEPPARRCRFDRQADAEYREARAHYEDEAGLIDAFEEEIRHAIELILAHPEAAPVVTREGARRWVLRRFPYSLFYTVGPTVVRIRAVAHHKRRPGYWRERFRTS